MHKHTTLYSAITLALGGLSMSAQAALTSSSSLSFDAGTPVVTSCTAGNFTGTSCTVSGTAQTTFEVTDMAGSYFEFEQGNENADKNAISQFAALHFGTNQVSSGAHTGTIDGSESPAIDNPWNFFKTTGMHTNTTPMIDLTGTGSTRSIEMNGWGMNWGDLGPGGVPGIPLAGTATLVCSTASCSDTSTYTLDMDVHVPQGFTSLPYSLHLEGAISSQVPVPAATWLFGSGLAGLIGVARRRRNSP